MASTVVNTTLAWAVGMNNPAKARPIEETLPWSGPLALLHSSSNKGVAEPTVGRRWNARGVAFDKTENIAHACDWPQMTD